MNRLIILILAGFFYSCDKTETEISLGEYRLTYKVGVESGLWYGNYLDGNGKSICVCEEPYLLDGWMHSFATGNLPDELSITVTSEFYADSSVVDKPEVSASIFLNGELLASSSANGKIKVTAQPTISFDTSGE